MVAAVTQQPAGPPPFATLGIVGLGLIGGSVARGVRRVWPGVTIAAMDRSGAAARACDEGLIDAVAGTASELAACDLIVVAVPVGAMTEILPDLATSCPDCIVTDAGSTKREVMRTAASVGLRRFVGGHPMAGAERAGLAYARADLFVGRPWLLVAGSAPEAGAPVEALVRGLGAAPRWVSAEEHDRAVAYLSHLPQLLSTALMRVAVEALGAGGLSAAGPAFAEMTRLAESPPDLWHGILSQNADYTVEAVERLAAALPSSAELTSAEWIKAAFSQAGEARRRWRSNDPATK